MASFQAYCTARPACTCTLWLRHTSSPYFELGRGSSGLYLPVFWLREDHRGPSCPRRVVVHVVGSALLWLQSTSDSTTDRLRQPLALAGRMFEPVFTFLVDIYPCSPHSLSVDCSIFHYPGSLNTIHIRYFHVVI